MPKSAGSKEPVEQQALDPVVLGRLFQGDGEARRVTLLVLSPPEGTGQRIGRRGVLGGIGHVHRQVEDEDRSPLDGDQVLALGAGGEGGDDENEEEQQRAAEDEEQGGQIGEKRDEKLFHRGKKRSVSSA